MRFETGWLTRAGLIAAVYAAVTWALAPISFGPVQFRVSEALTTLPILFPEAIPALFVGVMLANTIGGLGAVDIFGGSLVTLLAAYATYLLRGSWLAYWPPILFNAFLVSAYLAPMFGVPYWPTVGYIGLGQAGVVLLLGYPLVRLLERRFPGRSPRRVRQGFL